MNRFTVLLAAMLAFAGTVPAAAVAAPADYDIDTASSLQVVVNKQRPLNPATYVPSSLVRVTGLKVRSEAADAFKRLARAAKADGVTVTLVSGYRSYAQQESLYNDYVRQYGQATADTLSARPGFSEHQTGLAVDIGNPNGACALAACFASTPAGRWAADHADEYGFVIRYPEGSGGITGYTYEPWHLRYVGTAALAAEIEAAATMEQYFGLPPAPDYN
ncbi:M15 family metallopeptidase [Arthrobacter sp. I2-34]|uniref:M15 family metallopeptidase n=1 Tax=Arthrobacter hankyongi TaxID=2904801 RepID=A0ABS9LAF2_9MICC|nr:M15 family metallopeptidase [Arthrobacter hankyongi]MCG2623657.1 M15 family metallopeptidase [Arthrobacter hankyongi]